MIHKMLLKSAVVFVTGGVVYAVCKRHVKASAISNAKWNDNWDKRCHQTPTATRHIFLIRHGQYNHDAKTAEEKSLTALGREQSICTGKRLKELGLDKKLTSIFSSTKTRASETFKLIYEQLKNDSIPVEHTDLLHEGFPFQPEHPVEWSIPEPQVCFVDQSKLETAFRHFIHRADIDQEKDSFELFVCHGYVISYFVCRALQVRPEALLYMTVQNASITQLSIRPNGRVSLKGFGDVGHLPPDKLTFM